MSRSMLLPLLALGGIILFGTTRAGKPPPEEYRAAPVDLTPARVQLEAPPPMPPPPPAPRLRSDVEAEPSEPEAAPLADSTDAVTPADSLAAPSGP